MNTFKILFFFIFITSLNVSAQIGTNNRGRMQNNYSNPSKPTTSDIEKEKEKILDNFMTQLKKELILDDLQYIAIKNEIASNSRKTDVILKSQESYEDKAKEIEFSKEDTDKKIINFLSSKQKEKYIVFKENLNKKGKK